MMSHFRGCNNLVFLAFIIFFSFTGGTPAEAGLENPLVELSNREELVTMAGYGEEKLSTVLVSGTVLCLDGKDGLHPHPVSGASVALSCYTSGKTGKSNWVGGTTDEYGDFLMDLPSHLHAISDMEKLCIVKVLQLPKNSPCHPAFTGKHKGIKLSSVGNGIRTYTTQNICMTPESSQASTNTGGKRKEMVYVY